MTLRVENRNTRSKTCTSAILSTTNLTRTGLEQAGGKDCIFFKAFLAASVSTYLQRSTCSRFPPVTELIT
jgi:hypothetical protein